MPVTTTPSSPSAPDPRPAFLLRQPCTVQYGPAVKAIRSARIGIALFAVVATGFAHMPAAQGSGLPPARVTPPGQWSMFQNTPDRRGYTPLVGAQTSNLLWRYPTVANFGGAVIGRDGSVYIGTLEGRFLAFRPNGSLKWSVSVPYTF